VLFGPGGIGPMANDSQVLNLLRGLIILLLYQGIGEAITRYSGMPIPGPVIGMILLFLTLNLSGSKILLKFKYRGFKHTGLEHTAHLLIRGLPLMFIPACVGIFFLPNTQADQWPAIVGVIVLSTLVTLTATALVMKWLLRSEAKHP